MNCWCVARACSSSPLVTISALALVAVGISCYYKKAGAEYGFDVTSTQTFCEGGVRISSTAVRRALADDDLLLAETLLGHPFSISGRVVHGDELGRTIGFPTANLPLRRQVSPVKGVYAVEVTGLGDKPIAGVANIGTRPTVAGVRQQLEVHLLDVVMDLYGRHINVILRKRYVTSSGLRRWTS